MNLLGCPGGEAGLPTYYTILLRPGLSDEAAQFIVTKLSQDWERGGGGLVVRRQLPS